MEFIKNYFLKRRIKKNLNSKNDKIIIPEDITSVMIIANTKEELKNCEDKIKSNFGKSVDVSSYYFSETDQQTGVSKKDFNIIGLPNERLQGFLKNNVDFILTPSLNLNPYLLYLLLYSKTNLRIGFWSSENKQSLDFMLNKKTSTIKENIQNLLDYLIKIKAAC